MSAWRDVVDVFRDLAAAETRSTRTARFRVLRAGPPLSLAEIGGDTRLEEGDADVDLEALRLDRARPGPGDLVVLHRDGDEWVASAIPGPPAPGAPDPLDDPSPPLAKGARVVAGTVSATGVVAAGSGFTAARTATGLYRVVFAPAFRSLTAIVVTPGPEPALRVVKVKNDIPVTGAVAELASYTPAAVLVDGAFAFVAVGVA